MEEKNSQEQLKIRVRSAIKSWHPDRVGHPSNAHKGEQEVIHVLTALVGDAHASHWPEGVFQTGTKVIFPPLGHHTGNISIFLPSTPDEFLTILEHIKRTGDFPEGNFERVELKFSEAHQKKENEDPTLSKFQKFVMESDSIERLERAFDLFGLYSAEQLHSIHIPQLIDGRAEFLFTRDAWSAQDVRGFAAVREKVTTFRFFSPESRARTLRAIDQKTQEQSMRNEDVIPASLSEMEITPEQQVRETLARKEFIDRIRTATTPVEINSIVNEINNFTFFNRGELGVVRSALSRKSKKLGERKG